MEEIVIVGEDATPADSLLDRPESLPRVTGFEIVVLSRNWDSTRTAIVLPGLRELPKPINTQVLGSVPQGAGVRARSSRAQL